LTPIRQAVASTRRHADHGDCFRFRPEILKQLDRYAARLSKTTGVAVRQDPAEDRR